MVNLISNDHLRSVSLAGSGGINEDPIDRIYASIDPQAGGTFNGKPIFTADEAGAYLNRNGYSWYLNNYGELDDGVLNFGFWDSYDELASSYYVNTTGTDAFSEAFFSEDFSIFNAAQRAAARDSIGLWDDLISISFQETTATEGDINFGNTFTGGAQAYAYLPFGDIFDDFYEQFGFEETGRLGGDVWIDGFVGSNFFPIQPSYYSVTTLIHEIGHSLALSHPGDYNATDDNDGDGVADPITYANDAVFAQDSLQYSIMSYFDAYETGAQYVDWSLLNFAYPATPQVHDVAGIQRIYGADTTTRTGDTVYGFNSTADRDAFDFEINTRPIVTIWDAGGNDTLDFSGWDTNSVIDLNAGGFSSGGGIDEFLTLAEVNANRVALGFAPRSAATFAFYENLKAQLGLENGLFHDNIAIAYGATIENAVGGGGDDVIFANQVANRITGNGGSDTVSYAFSTGGVYASLASTGGGNGYAKGDILISVENLEGSDFNDTLVGDNSANTLSGGDGADDLRGAGGDDILVGGMGSDKHNGGQGTDTASYAGAAGGVTVNLATGGTEGEAAGDTYQLVENLLGSDHDDVLTGSSLANRIDGGDGDDLIDGAAGNDVLFGGLGDDTVKGGTGNDTIHADAGDDTLTGGVGRDTFVLDVADFDDSIIDFQAGQDKIDVSDLGSFAYRGTAAFSGVAGQLRSEAIVGGGVTLMGDIDGDGTADFAIDVFGVSAIRAVDLVLI
jgi:Peptidase M10 serralysin C terminal/RTX calcium-binding nonapeptide repeat (4 copies)